MLIILSLCRELHIKYEMLRDYESYGDKDMPSSQSKILDNCFVISSGNVPYEPLKHFYGFR